MNRVDFMRQLESLLQNISPTEREEALQYYNDYFNDAGEENEQAVIEALGNPAKVAENIKRDLYGAGYGDGVYQKAASSDRAVVQYQQPDLNRIPETQKQPEKTGVPTWAIVLLVIAAVLFSPALLGIAAGIFGTLCGIIVTWFALIFSFGIVAVALLILLLVLAVTGMMCLWADPVVSLGLLGGGLICGGIGILFLMLTVAMAGIATPAAVKGICSLFGRMKKK